MANLRLINPACPVNASATGLGTVNVAHAGTGGHPVYADLAQLGEALLPSALQPVTRASAAERDLFPDNGTRPNRVPAVRPAQSPNLAFAAAAQLVNAERPVPKAVAGTPSQEFTLTLSGNRAPYHRHQITVWRNTLGRLAIEIESYTAADPRANPDNVCARAESGPVTKLGRAMFKLMPRHVWAQTALKAGMPIHTYVEWVNDLELAWQGVQLENRGPAGLPVVYRAEV